MSSAKGHEQLLTIMSGFQPACVLGAAAELDVFSALAAEAHTAAELASKLKADPRALALRRARYKSDELSPARRRMARMPVGAELVDNPVSPPPGFRIGNVIVNRGGTDALVAVVGLTDTVVVTRETRVILGVNARAVRTRSFRGGKPAAEMRMSAWLAVPNVTTRLPAPRMAGVIAAAPGASALITTTCTGSATARVTKPAA